MTTPALTAESEALLDGLEVLSPEVSVWYRSERDALVAAARDVWDHWVNGIGWFDGYDGTRPDKTAIHLTQMTVEDEQEMTRRMDVLAEALGIEERYYEGPGLAAIEGGRT